MRGSLRDLVLVLLVCRVGRTMTTAASSHPNSRSPMLYSCSKEHRYLLSVSKETKSSLQPITDVGRMQIELRNDPCKDGSGQNPWRRAGTCPRPGTGCAPGMSQNAHSATTHSGLPGFKRWEFDQVLGCGPLALAAARELLPDDLLRELPPDLLSPAELEPADESPGVSTPIRRML